MNKKQRRKQKGRIVGYVLFENIQGKNKNKLNKKSVREHVLNDVIRLKNQNCSNKEIHEFLCKEYGFRDNNPIEKRYLKYINKKKKEGFYRVRGK